MKFASIIWDFADVDNLDIYKEKPECGRASSVLASMRITLSQPSLHTQQQFFLARLTQCSGPLFFLLYVYK